MTALTLDRHLTPDQLAEVAELRARGRSWQATAEELGWDGRSLRRVVRSLPEFDRLYTAAEREVRREAEAEMLLLFRAQLRDADPGTAGRAAEGIAKHLAAARRDETRLTVERLRADTARARLEAKRAPADGEPAEPPAGCVHQPAVEALHARRAAEARAVVWLWGGAHPVGGVGPDAASDTPLVLFADDTAPGGKLYWAARVPLACDPCAGPFPAPPQPPPPVLTPEQVKALGG